VLSGGAKLFEPAAPAEPGEGGTPLTTDAANFPYPWYITQVRESLWTAWTERMPSAGSLRCTMRFVITRSGAVKSVSVEKSSGNRLFDSAAESSVQAAAPFQTLPDDFLEDRLTVHVEFKAGE
jgi:TonB family protein